MDKLTQASNGLESNALEKTNYVNLLYDFYQSLLTAKQRTYLEMYYHDDLSLGEIAEDAQVSRQAVFENIKRAEQLLRQYENSLQLLAKHEQRSKLFGELDEALSTLEEQIDSSEKLEDFKNIVTALQNVD